MSKFCNTRKEEKIFLFEENIFSVGISQDVIRQGMLSRNSKYNTSHFSNLVIPIYEASP